MSIDSQYENEMDILEEQLANGEITMKEYNRAVREIEQETRDYYQGRY